MESLRLPKSISRFKSEESKGKKKKKKATILELAALKAGKSI